MVAKSIEVLRLFELGGHVRKKKSIQKKLNGRHDFFIALDFYQTTMSVKIVAKNRKATN